MSSLVLLQALHTLLPLDTVARTCSRQQAFNVRLHISETNQTAGIDLIMHHQHPSPRQAGVRFKPKA